MLAAAAAGDLDVLVLLGADPLSDFPDADLAARALAAVGTVVAVETLPNPSTLAHADVVLPAAAPTEAVGTFTNLEGRVSVSNQKVTPPGTARAAPLRTEILLPPPRNGLPPLEASCGTKATSRPGGRGDHLGSGVVSWSEY